MQSFTALWVHFIWATKYREPIIDAGWKLDLYQQIRLICQEKGYYLDFINGISDHVHLLIGLRGYDCVSEVVKNIKGLSQLWVRTHIVPQDYFSWQDGYTAISVSPSNVRKVRAYIRKQETHHQQQSTEEELNLIAQSANAYVTDKDER